MSNPFLDQFLPIFNGGLLFKQLAIVAGILFLWLGGTRARVCILMMLLAVGIGDGLICNTIKKSVARDRPFNQLENVNVLAGRGSAKSMPSSHAANATAIAIVLGVFYRRARPIAYSIAALVCLARVYSGVHFPSDVIVGALLAVNYTWLILFGLEYLWRKKAPDISPALAQRIPSLLNPPNAPPPTPAPARPVAWKKLGLYVIGTVLVLRLIYVAGDKIELSEDEAYQWQWSKHLALSYYSKPPLIAYTQFLGTSLFGDTAFGIRFLSPIFAALCALVLLNFLSRNFNERAAFFTVAALLATPMPAVGATLMTIDALSVLFWTLAFIAGWKAIQLNSIKYWTLTGLAIAGGLLAKYVAIFQWLSFLLFLALCAPRQFRKPGLYLAFLISLLGLLPVIIWNQQNNWITLTHLSERSGLDSTWKFQTRFLNDFFWSEFGLLNPVFFVLIIWAAIRFWKNRTPFQTFLFCMGGPLFLGYLFYTLRARVQPNWIAPAILPLFALAATYWEPRFNKPLKRALAFGFGLGFIAVILLHDTNLTGKLLGFSLPAKLDPLRRVRAWSTLAATVEQERQKQSADFVIGAHYGLTSLMRFYTQPRAEDTFVLSTQHAHNQYYFWPNYTSRTGQTAIFVQRADKNFDLPPEITEQFQSVVDLGIREIPYRNRPFHTIRLYLCRNLQPQPSDRR